MSRTARPSEDASSPNDTLKDILSSNNTSDNVKGAALPAPDDVINGNGTLGIVPSDSEACYKRKHLRETAGSTECKPLDGVSDDCVLVYDGTLEGFLTCIFRCFESKVYPSEISPQNEAQPSLLSETVNVETSKELAFRVRDGIASKLGKDEFNRILLGFLSDDPQRGIKLLRYIRIAMHEGRYAFCNHANPYVADYERLWTQVSNERHHMLQFARFAELENGVFICKIAPNANVVPAMMGHFTNRFNTESFIIFDEVHDIAGVYSNGDWCMVETDSLNLPQESEDEKRYSAMWRTFYNTICNEQRLNPKLRSGWMPKRFWGNITEMIDEIPDDLRRK
ncbi:MAG: TIGR03915 family putative DNA repair protein [Coriobacteriales bacterium]|jgi:probable DNA metabolism protein